MQSFIRWGTALGLTASVVLGASFVPVIQQQTQVLALTEDQIVAKLKSVPVFTITNQQGSPLVATVKESKDKTPVAGAFISQQDAQAFLDNLKSRDPKLAQNVKVVPISLADVYKLSQKEQSKSDAITFSFVPMQQQVDSALALLKQTDPKATRFNGVPLFVARGGKDKGYLTIQQDSQQIIPLFFKKEDLQALLDRFKQQKPEMASTLDVQVVNLEGVIQTLKSGKDQQLNQLMLVPPKESLDFVRSTQGGQPGRAPAPTPQTAPAPAPKK
jgi:nickel transport protein